MKVLYFGLFFFIFLIFIIDARADVVSYTIFSDDFDGYKTGDYLDKWGINYNQDHINVSNLTSFSPPNSIYIDSLPVWIKPKMYDGGNELNLSFYSEQASFFGPYSDDTQFVAGKYIFLFDNNEKTIGFIRISTADIGANNGSYNVYASDNSTYIFRSGPIYLSNLVKLYSKSKLPKSWDHFYIKNLNNTHYSVFWNNSVSQGNQTLKKNIESDKIYYIKFFTDNWFSSHDSYYDDIRVSFKTEFSPESVPPFWSDKFQTNYTESQPHLITLGARWNDNDRLYSVILSTNKTGEWINETARVLSSRDIWSNYTINTINITNNTTIAWRIYANDTSGNANVTDISTFKINPKLEKVPPVIRESGVSNKLLVLNKTFSTFDIWSIVTDDSSLSSVSIHIDYANGSKLTYPFSSLSRSWFIMTFTINSSDSQSLPRGKNSFYINATDVYGNMKLSDNFTFYIVNATDSLDAELPLNGSMIGTIGNSTTIKSTLTIKLNESLNNRNISMAYYDTPINNVTNWVSTFGRYYSIEPSDNVTKYMEWVLIKMYYTDSEIGGANESLLRLGFYNASSDKIELCILPNGGVDIDNNFVYCNTTHFSEWGIYQDKRIPALTLTATPSWATTTGVRTTVSCSANTNEITPNLYRNNIQVSNPDIQTLSTGSYSYLCNNTETLNYTNNSVSNTLTVATSSGSSNGGGSYSGSSDVPTITPIKPKAVQPNETNINKTEVPTNKTINTTIEPNETVEENKTKKSESKISTGFATLVHPALYPIVSILIIALILVIYYLKKPQKGSRK